MKKRSFVFVLNIMLSIVLCFISIILFYSYFQEKSYFDTLFDAAMRMERVEAYLKNRVIEKGFEITLEDINATGLVGPDFTELTSTPGDEREKRSTLNPYSASVVASMLLDAGIKKGDTIAIGASGSYPGFLISALSASSSLGLDTKLILSLGSSMYGATRVEYNIFDIARDARESGEIDYDLLALSRGYKDDRGGSVLENILYEGTEELSLEICKREADLLGVTLINEPTLQDSIDKRLELFGDVKLFVNVGGAPVNIGDGTFSFSVPVGLVMNYESVPQGEGRGMVYEYLDRGVPIINLLDSKGFSEKYGVEFDASPLPSVERITPDTSFFVAGIFLLSLAVIIFVCSVVFKIRGEKNES